MENVETNEPNNFRYFSDEISSKERENAGTRKQSSLKMSCAPYLNKYILCLNQFWALL